MYLVLDSKDMISAITPQINYVRTQTNGTTIITDKETATAVYAAANDTFYPLRETAPGDALYHVVEIENVPEGAEIGTWRYADGALILDQEAATAKDRAVTQRPAQLRADLDYIMLMGGL